MNMVEVIPQLGQWAIDHPALILGGAGGMVVVMAATSLLTKGRRRVALDTHGTARWSIPQERAQIGLSLTHGVVIGCVDGKVYCDDWPTHVLTIGRSRSGKGMFHIRPTLRWFWRQSLLALDPKNGENWLASRREREQMGRVEVFAPYRWSPCKLNVCDSIRFGDPAEYGDALSIGSSLTAPHTMGMSYNDTAQHFQQTAAMVLAAAQLHVWYTTQHCSLGHVWHFLTQRAGTSDGKRLLDTLKAMRSTAHVSQGVHMAIASISNAISNISGDRELGSIWSTAFRPLALYNAPYVAQATDTSTLNVRELQFGPQPVSLFLLAETPRAAEDMYEVYRVVVDTVLKVVMRREGEALPEHYDHRLLLCLDELPLYGYMPSLASQTAAMAGYGIKGWFLAQDIPQLDRVYGKDSAVWSNTDSKLFHAPGNDSTAIRISDMLGEGTVEYLVQSQGGGMRGRGTVTPHRQARALLTADEVQTLDPSLGILHSSGRGLHPFVFGKLGYDPAYQEATA